MYLLANTSSKMVLSGESVAKLFLSCLTLKMYTLFSIIRW